MLVTLELSDVFLFLDRTMGKIKSIRGTVDSHLLEPVYLPYAHY